MFAGGRMGGTLSRCAASTPPAASPGAPIGLGHALTGPERPGRGPNEWPCTMLPDGTARPPPLSQTIRSDDVCATMPPLPACRRLTCAAKFARSSTLSPQQARALVGVYTMVRPAAAAAAAGGQEAIASTCAPRPERCPALTCRRPRLPRHPYMMLRRTRAAAPPSPPSPAPRSRRSLRPPALSTSRR